MSKLPAILLTCLLVCTPDAIAQSKPAPATKPTDVTAPVEQLFSNDTLGITVPAGWRVARVGDDTNSLVFALEKPHAAGAVMAVNTTPQTSSLTQTAEIKFKIGKGVVELMTKELAAKNIESVDAPAVKHDDGFFLRVEDSYKSDGKVAHRLHVYRVIGIHLLMATVTSFAPDDAGVNADWKVAERAINSVKPNKIPRVFGVPTGQKPGLFRLAKVKLAPAKGWLEERADKADGVISTFRQQVGGNVVTVRVTPMDAQKESRAAVVARVVAEDVASATKALVDATRPGTTVEAGDVETTAGDGAIDLRAVQKPVRTGLAFRVETRAKMVGNVVLTVTSSSTEKRAVDGVAQWADDLATTAEPFPAPR